MNKKDLTKLIKECIKELSNINEIQISNDFQKVNQHVYSFSVGDLSYRLEAEESVELVTNKKVIEIKFRLLNNPKQPNIKDFKNQLQYQIAIKKSQVGITNTGNPIKVFSRVLGIVTKLINDINPDYITFTADEENRQGLYNKLILMMEKYIPNYEKVDINPITNEKINPEEFWLKKKD